MLSARTDSWVAKGGDAITEATKSPILFIKTHFLFQKCQTVYCRFFGGKRYTVTICKLVKFVCQKVDVRESTA